MDGPFGWTYSKYIAFRFSWKNQWAPGFTNRAFSEQISKYITVNLSERQLGYFSTIHSSAVAQLEIMRCFLLNASLKLFEGVKLMLCAFCFRDFFSE